MDEYRFEIHKPNKRGDLGLIEENIIIEANSEDDAGEKAKQYATAKYGKEYGNDGEGWRIQRIRLTKLSYNPDNQI